MDESNVVSLNAEGVHLDLEDGGLDFAVLEDFTEHHELDVGNSDVLGETLVLEFFHSSVSLLVSNIFIKFKAFLFTFGIVDPFRRVSYFGVNILEVNREVDNVKIEVFESEIRQGSLDSRFNMLGSVESVPQLRYDEKIFTLADAFIKGLLDSLANFLFVSIITGSIEKSVSAFDSVVNLAGTDFLGEFPETETNLRHFGTTVEFEGGHL